MGRETAEVQTVDERPSFEALQVVVGLVLHLPVQDFESVEPHLGGKIDAQLDVAVAGIAELPERVGGDHDAIAALARGFRLVGSPGQPRSSCHRQHRSRGG
jgi:hypothetical protein